MNRPVPAFSWERVSRAEGLAIGCTLVLALIARIWQPANVGINHYDEGVYAFSANGLADSADRHLFPNQIRFSPPFFFTATSVLSQLLRLEPDAAGILLNVVLGTLTVAVVWAVGRTWFSPGAGLAAAILLAGNQFHIMMSRVALTDAAFAFFFVSSLGALVWAFERSSLRLALLAGVLTGFTWNTKYHGWFVLVITGVALLPALWLNRPDNSSTKTDTARRSGPVRLFVLWGVAALVAGLMYVPWAAYMRVYAGPSAYRNVIAYYMTLLRVDWLGGIGRHAALQAFLDGPMSRAAVLVACSVVMRLAGRLRAPTRVIVVIAGLTVGLWLVGGAAVLVLLAAATLPELVKTFATLRTRVLLAWIGLWVVAAPFYHPYARLLLPFTIGLCLLAGWQLVNLLVTRDNATQAVSARWAALALAAAVLVAVMPPLLPTGGNPWRPSRSAAQAAARIAEHVTAGERIYVIGEPQIAYYLLRAGRDADPVSEGIEILDTLSNTSYLVTGVYTQRAPLLRNTITKLGPRLTLIDTVEFRPSDLRLLDDFRPDRARQYLASPDSTFDLTLYRLLPAGR